MKKHNIIFMGTPDFSVPILKAVHETYGVSTVITQPDKPVGRKRVLTPPPVKVMAEQLNIEVYQPENMKDEASFEYIQSLNPDLIITAAYGQILPESILNLPEYGCINVHASLLPKYRGGAPIHKSIINGEKQSGVTIMYMVRALDAGNMINRVKVEIDINDTAGSLHDKLSAAGTELLIETLPAIFNRTNESIPQNHEEATFATNISREEEYVTFDRDHLDVHNHIRGLSPWPVAYAKLNGQTMKLWSSQLSEGHGLPGQIIKADKYGIEIACANGSVIITEIQPAGKKKMNSSQYVSGLKEPLEGARFNEE